jgi:hypothetical protein
MIFDEEFIDALQNDFVTGVLEICDKCIRMSHPYINSSKYKESYPILIEGFALVDGLVESGMFPLEVTIPELKMEDGFDSNTIFQFFIELRKILIARDKLLKFEQMKSRFKTSLGGVFVYEFSQGDLEKVQTLLSQLRDQIVASKFIEKEHQQRILRRLEKLQAELHKRVSDLDRFWGLIGDAGVALGKFGNDAKPIVDRIKEITEIVWQTQSRAEELPSGTPIPQLENKPSTEA